MNLQQLFIAYDLLKPSQTLHTILNWYNSKSPNMTPWVTVWWYNMPRDLGLNGLKHACELSEGPHKPKITTNYICYL